MEFWDIVAKYWLQFFLGGMGGIVTYLFKKYLKLLQAEKLKQQELFYTTLREEINASYNKAQDSNKELKEDILELSQQIQFLKAGILSVQKKEFIANCRALLEDGKEITLDEYTRISADHEAYNQLGGNHEGDQIFSFVSKKFEGQMFK